MELYAAVQPLVLTLEGYQMIYGEDDPEELALMQLEDKERAREIDEVLHDLYFLETSFAEPRDGEGLAEEIGTLEDLYELRHIAAESQGRTVDDYQEGRVPAGFLFNHLINHADADGFYLPVDFPQAFFMEELSLGSAVALLRELEALQPILAKRFPGEVALALATSDDEVRAPIAGPVGVWHALSRLCRSSIVLGMPIHLG
jgi:hypothetical protein